MLAQLRIATLAVALVLSAGRMASAQDEWVFGGYVGATHTLGGALSIAQPPVGTDVTFASVDYEGRSLSAPIYYGYRIAYVLPPRPWLAVEMEFIHMKAYAHTDAVARVSGTRNGASVEGQISIRNVVESFSLSHGLNFALINGVARRVVAARGNDTLVALVARAGIGPTIPHAESRIAGAVHEGYEIGAPGIQVASGIEVGLRRGLFVIAEYKLTTTNQTVAVSDGHARGRFTSHHVVAGLSWRIG